MNDSPSLYKSSQVLILPCESEHLVRCCSVIPKSIESSHADEFSQNIHLEDELVTKNEPKEYSTEQLTQFVENESFDESSEKYSTTKWIPTESLLEKLPSDAAVLSLTTEVPRDSSTMNVNDVEDKNSRRLTIDKNIVAPMNEKQDLQLKQHIPTHQQEQTYLKQFLKPRSIRIRILNNESTNASSTIRFPHPEQHVRQSELKVELVERVPEVSFSAKEQDLIDQAMNFESIKVSYSRKRILPEFKETKEQMGKNITGINKFLFLRRTIINADYRSNASFKFLSMPKSVSENTGNHFKQKASLESSLTLDRVSIRATNENAKPQSKLSKLRDGVTSITNLSYPEGTKSSKRIN